MLPFAIRHPSTCVLFLGAYLFAFPGAFRETANAQNLPHPVVTLPNWQFGLFATGGVAPNYQLSNSFQLPNGQSDTLTGNVKLDFWNAGFVGGRMLSGVHGPGVLRGRTEAMLEIMPFWLARYPKQSIVFVDKLLGGTETNPDYGPVDKYGASVTPFLIRYNFQHHPDTRFLPWAQLGGGLLWTNHKFPYGVGSTSVINFTPQGGVGISTFTCPRQSVDLALKVVHISSAGLGDYNPGIDYTLQFSAGYSWWK